MAFDEQRVKLGFARDEAARKARVMTQLIDVAHAESWEIKLHNKTEKYSWCVTINGVDFLVVSDQAKEIAKAVIGALIPMFME